MAATASPKRVLNARVQADLIERVQERADREERSLSNAVRVALREYVERETLAVAGE